VRFATFIVAVTLILGGCAPQVQRPMRFCQGMGNASESLSLLRSQAQKTVPLKAYGKCRAKFYLEERKKPHKEIFPVKLWFSPPCCVRLQGNVAFNPRGIEFGSNESEFWLSMQPKEIGNSYFWGRWNGETGFGELKISPKVLLEAFGIIEIGDKGGWTLSNGHGFDVLTKQDERGLIIKKVHIYNCDYTVRKIEYFDKAGRPEVVIELDKYEDIYNGASVPAIIRIVSYNDNDTKDSFEIRLDSIKFMQTQPEGLFGRTQPRRFKHVYRIVDGSIVEQQQ